MVERYELADPPPHRHAHQMGALQAEGVEQADGILCQVAQGVGRSTRLVADRSAGVAVVVADDEPGSGHQSLAEPVLPPVHRGCPSHDEEDGGSALSPNVWTQRSTPLARMILSLGSIGRTSGLGVGGCSGAWASSLLFMMGRSLPNGCSIVYSEHTAMATCSAGSPSATSPSTSHSAPAGRKAGCPRTSCLAGVVGSTARLKVSRHATRGGCPEGCPSPSCSARGEYSE